MPKVNQNALRFGKIEIIGDYKLKEMEDTLTRILETHGYPEIEKKQDEDIKQPDFIPPIKHGTPS
jgi:hypothetical protein